MALRPVANKSARHHVAVIILLTCLFTLAACAPNAPETSLPQLPPPSNDTEPPDGVAELTQIYGPALETLGYKLTRASTYDLDPSTDKTNLNLGLYATPIDNTDSVYASGFWNLTRLLAGDVFNRWPDLASFDICQERPNAAPGEAPVTQVALDRAVASQIDWTSGDIDELTRAVQNETALSVTIGPPADKAAELEALMNAVRD